MTISVPTPSSPIKEELSESGESIGIEQDELENEIDPFNPHAISIEQKVVSMDVILRRLKQKSINLSPSFQRKEVWDDGAKSRLIESIMLKIPLPMFYVSADENSIWEVVDGLQRLSAIRDFMIGNDNGVYLKLKKLEFLGEKYNYKTYVAIENDNENQKLLNDIYETELRFTVINPGTPEAVKRNIFKRINTGGMPLTSQEIRHALYEGQSSELLHNLVSSEIFANAFSRTINDSRLGVTELVLRLISFMIFERKDYKSNMDSWLSNTMRVLNHFPCPDPIQMTKIFGKEDDIPQLKIETMETIIEQFSVAMTRSLQLFDGHAFRKSLPGDQKKNPINKSLFEVWGIILAELSDEAFEQLKQQREYLLTEYEALLKNDEFNSAISRNSGTNRGVQHRYQAVKNLVNEPQFKSQI